MKKGLLLTFVCILVHVAFGQNTIKQENTAEQSGKPSSIETPLETLIELDDVGLHMDVKVRKSYWNYTIPFCIHVKNTDSIHPKDGIHLLLEDNDIIKMKVGTLRKSASTEEGGCRFEGTLPMSNYEVKQLRQHKVRSVCIVHGNTKQEQELPTERQDLFIKMLKQIDAGQ